MPEFLQVEMEIYKFNRSSESSNQLKIFYTNPLSQHLIQVFYQKLSLYRFLGYLAQTKNIIQCHQLETRILALEHTSTKYRQTIFLPQLASHPPYSNHQPILIVSSPKMVQCTISEQQDLTNMPLNLFRISVINLVLVLTLPNQHSTSRLPVLLGCLLTISRLYQVVSICHLILPIKFISLPSSSGLDRDTMLDQEEISEHSPITSTYWNIAYKRIPNIPSDRLQVPPKRLLHGYNKPDSHQVISLSILLEFKDNLPILILSGLLSCPHSETILNEFN